MGRTFALALLAFAVLTASVRADDYGPPRDVRQMRSDAMRLLAHRERGLGLEPKALKVSDVVVVGNEAFLSWDNSRDHGVMGLVRHDDRWWDAYQAAGQPGSRWWAMAFPPMKETWYFTTALPSVAQLKSAGFDDAVLTQAQIHNADVRASTAQGRAVLSMADSACSVLCGNITKSGGDLHSTPDHTAGYEVWFTFARNDAAGEQRATLLYARAPTHAEFLPNPPPPKDWGGSTDVGFFDFDLSGTQPVTFNAGTAVDIWFPFVLDDTLRYDVSLFTGDKAYGPYHGTLFDNVLHFELPAFTVVPGKGFQAEISGWY